MIGKLKGVIDELNGNIALLETSGGVYYKTFITPNIISTHKIGDKITLYTYLQVRDDALILFGFSSKEEHTFFELLLSVPGVGPKTAYTVISYGKILEIIQAVKDNDIAYFSQIKGLGKKTAMKIILELSEKLKQEFSMEKMYLSEDDKIAVDALISLGYSSNDSRNLISKLPKNISVEEKIKHALRIIK